MAWYIVWTRDADDFGARQITGQRRCSSRRVAEYDRELLLAEGLADEVKFGDLELTIEQHAHRPKLGAIIPASPFTNDSDDSDELPF